MQFAFLIGFLLTTSSVSFFAQGYDGQIDMSSEMLLSTSPKNIEDVGLQTGRYKQRKPSKLPEKKISPNLQKQTTDLMNPVTVVPSTQTAPAPQATPAPVAPKKTELHKSLFESDYNPAQTAKTTSGSLAASVSGATAKTVSSAITASATSIPEQTIQVVPSAVDQMKSLVFGDDQAANAIEVYKEQVHEDDIRMNQVEVSILPGLIANDSKSNYSFRNYSTSSPKLELEAKFWLSPFLGIYGQYLTSMGGDVTSNPGTRSRVSAQQEYSEFGFEIRKFYGLSRRANSITYGMHFSEYKFSVPGDDVYRIKLRSSGFGFHLGARIPVAPSYSWVFGSKLSPRLQSDELPTGIDLSSGDLGECTRVDLSIGGEIKFSRQNQMTWSLIGSFEKIQYNGQSSQLDPETGSTPKGVSVENRLLILSFGYRWGQ